MTLSVREDLIQALSGQSIRIPDLGKTMAGWPQGVNPKVEVLRDEIEARIDMYEHFYCSS